MVALGDVWQVRINDLLPVIRDIDLDRDAITARLPEADDRERLPLAVDGVVEPHLIAEPHVREGNLHRGLRDLLRRGLVDAGLVVAVEGDVRPLAPGLGPHDGHEAGVPAVAAASVVAIPEGVPVDHLDAEGSEPRNETMMKMFTLISVGERAGGGIPNMVKKWTSSGYGAPVLSERVNPERSTILLPLVKESVGNDVGNVGNDVGNVNSEAVTTAERVLRLIAGNPKISAQSIAAGLGMSKRHIERVMAGLRDEGILIREGGTRGSWVIAKNR